MMAAYWSGRDADNEPHAGEVEIDEIPILMSLCEAFEWRRVAVAESAGWVRILAFRADGKTWINPWVTS